MLSKISSDCQSQRSAPAERKEQTKTNEQMMDESGAAGDSLGLEQELLVVICVSALDHSNVQKRVFIDLIHSP